MTEDRIKSAQFRQRFASMVLEAMNRPVVITSYNRPKVVMISHEQYERVRSMLYDLPPAIEPARQ